MIIDSSPATAVPSRLSAPGVIVTLFVLVMSACVLGLVIWKAIDARRTALAQSKITIENLAHSLVEHASHTIQSADVAMSGMADLLQHPVPSPEHFKQFLSRTVGELPQLREIGVLDARGDWRYSSLPEMPKHNNADREYFSYHRDHAETRVRVNAPLRSRLNGRLSILLTKRLSGTDGSFNGVLIAAIDSDYFQDFYRTFQLGPGGGISLLRTDGIMLEHWPSQESGKDLSGSGLFQVHLKRSPVGYYKIASPFDGLTKYFGYEQAAQYPLIVAVAVLEDQLLSEWRSGLLSDVVVASVLLCSVILLAALLSTQFRFRLRIEHVLREREQRYRLLADNIADVVVLLDQRGHFVFVSPSVRSVLGHNPHELVGRSCFRMVHPDDRHAVMQATRQLADAKATHNAVFRTTRQDGTLAWVEINFKRASRADDHARIEVVGVLRDVTQRKWMQDELTAANARLSELATTDGLTGLANRRTLDGFLRREYGMRERISVLLIDIDNFKSFNDSMGHQAGDDCLQQVAAVVASATAGSFALSARYGGEEFAIILPNVTEANAMIVAETVRRQVYALGIVHGAVASGILSISIGVASRTAVTADETGLLGEADRALYDAKRRGRDCCVAASSLTAGYRKTGLVRHG